MILQNVKSYDDRNFEKERIYPRVISSKTISKRRAPKESRRKLRYPLCGNFFILLAFDGVDNVCLYIPCANNSVHVSMVLINRILLLFVFISPCIFLVLFLAIELCIWLFYGAFMLKYYIIKGDGRQNRTTKLDLKLKISKNANFQNDFRGSISAQRQSDRFGRRLVDRQ